MKDSRFTLEFEIDREELYKINCAYFKRMYERKIKFLSLLFVLPFIFFDLSNIDVEKDVLKWFVMSVGIVLMFLLFHPLIMNLICKIVVNRDSQVVEYSDLLGNYKYDFTESEIKVQSPIGFSSHKWSQLDKVILTREYLLLYISKTKGYVISRSQSKCKNDRKMHELIFLVESSAGQMIRI